MKNLRQVISLILFLSLAASIIFNILYMLDMISRALVRGGFVIFLVILFIVSLLGLILKDIRKEETVQLNIITPVKEIGPVYVWALILWVITNGIVLLFNWQLSGW